LIAAVIVAFIAVFPYSQSLGPALMALALAIVLATAAAGRRRLVLSTKDLLFAAYALAAAVMAARSPAELRFYVQLVLFPWVTSLVFQNVRLSERRVDLFLSCMIVTCLIVTGYMLFQVSPGQFDFSLAHLLTLDRNIGFYFLSPERIGPNMAAAMSSAAIVLALSKVGFSPKPGGWLFASLAISTLFLIVAGARVWWVGTAICILMFFFFRGGPSTAGGRLPGLRMVILLFVVGAVGISAVRSIAATQGEVLQSRMEGVTNPVDDHNLKARLIHWARAIRMIEQRPAGWGFNAYFSRYRYTPHNELLGQAVSIGVLGAVLYFILLGYVWLLVLRMPRESLVASRVRFAALSLLITYTLAMATEHVSRGTATTVTPIFWALIGMSVGAGKMPGLVRSPTSSSSKPIPMFVPLTPKV
jgi:hypothetical protein